MVKNINTILVSIIAGLIIAKIQPDIVIYVIVALIIILLLINIFWGPKDRIKIKSLKKFFVLQ